MSTSTPLICAYGPTVTVGPLLSEQIPLYLQLHYDPELSTFSFGSFLLPAVSTETSRLQTLINEGLAFSIYRREDDQLIGFGGLMNLDQQHGTAHLWISLGPKIYWGHGYGTEATKLLLEYGFRHLNLHSIALMTAGFNARAQRAYQKAGFQDMGRWREATKIGGRRYDVVYIDCLAAEFNVIEPGWFRIETSNDRR